MSESRVRAVLRMLVLAATALAASNRLALADETTVFEWREANGVTSYSQRPPPPGARGVTSKSIDTQSFTPSQRAAVRAELARSDAAEQADSARYRHRMAAADRAVDRALQAQQAAERAARTGRRPQAGERVANAGGGSRLRTDYFDRQKRLEDAVQQARSQVEEAYRMRTTVMP